ncbi:hypothetical protein JNM05_10675 [bacterium]|nr:hypothetical protein [bacterium]
MSSSIRGTYEFEITKEGNVISNSHNLEKLRELFLDKAIVNNALGPGDPGDFDYGAWHILCHLAAACAVFRRPSGELLWVEISHLPVIDIYTATVTVECSRENVTTFPLNSSEGKALLDGPTMLGFVEGTSLGHISARSVRDTADKFNNNLRQDYEHDVESPKDGGRVWEHWCTVRDIRVGNIVGTSVLRAYLDIVAICGGHFVGVVGRGRGDYDHPIQLAALVNAGLLSVEEALVEITPIEIPNESEQLICSSNPRQCVIGARLMNWSPSRIAYQMFNRSIGSWCNTIRLREYLTHKEKT